MQYVLVVGPALPAAMRPHPGRPVRELVCAACGTTFEPLRGADPGEPICDECADDA